VVGPPAVITAAGTGLILKVLSEVAVPAGVATETVPDCWALTIAEIAEGDSTWKEIASKLPILTAVAPVKLLPMIFRATESLLHASAGVKELMPGTRATGLTVTTTAGETAEQFFDVMLTV